MNSFLRPLLLAAALAFSAPASALMIQISTNEDFSGCDPDLANQCISFDDGGTGVASTNEGLGNWIVNVVTGVSSPILGDDNFDNFDLNSINVSNSAGGTLYIRLTETDFTRGDSTFSTMVGGTTDGSVSFQLWADYSNEAFGQGELLSDSGLLSGGAFSGTDSGSISPTGDYSMSIYATITHAAGIAGTTSFDYNVKVPEPGTLGLLGIGLLGMGLGARRKRHVA